jgi:hypothetical protein
MHHVISFWKPLKCHFHNSPLSPPISYSIKRLVTTATTNQAIKTLVPVPIMPTYYCNSLDGLVITVLATGLKVRGFKPAKGDGFLRVIQIRSMTSFGGKVKPATPCRKILLHVTDPYGYEIDTCRQNSRTCLAKFLLLRY